RGPRSVVDTLCKHCVLQDVTFVRPLELRGPFGALLEVLRVLTDPLDGSACSPPCTQGLVEVVTHLYRFGSFPLGCMAPVNLLWSPQDHSYLPQASRGSLGHSPGPRSADARESRGGAGEELEERRVWVWVHPAAYVECLDEIREACARLGTPWAGRAEVGPVSGGLGRLRLRGARAHEILSQVLRPHRLDRPNQSPMQPSSPTAAGEQGCLGGVVAGEGSSEDDGGVFEASARESGERWLRLASPHHYREGVGAGARMKGILPNGSVFAVTAVDPRERHPLKQSAVQGRGGGNDPSTPSLGRVAEAGALGEGAPTKDMQGSTGDDGVKATVMMEIT
ncbi:unnamed protein product, partial [Discosporangium mesarthrocarpum]